MVRYVILVLAVVAAVMVFGVLVYPETPSDQCIYIEVYGLGEGKMAQPLPCYFKGMVNIR